MRKTERYLEKKRKKKGGSNWEKIGWNEDKKICPFDAKKVCPVTFLIPLQPLLSSFYSKRAKPFSLSQWENKGKYERNRPCRVNALRGLFLRHKILFAHPKGLYFLWFIFIESWSHNPPCLSQLSHLKTRLFPLFIAFFQDFPYFSQRNLKHRKTEIKREKKVRIMLRKIS